MKTSRGEGVKSKAFAKYIKDHSSDRFEQMWEEGEEELQGPLLGFWFKEPG